MAFLPLRKAVTELGLHPNTLRKYADDNRIPTIRNAAGQRLFDVDAFKRTSVAATVVCYCRVSSHKQRDDLERQAERLAAIHPQAEIVKDLGSGLNFKRKGLLALLGRLVRGEKLRVVVTTESDMRDIISAYTEYRKSEIEKCLELLPPASENALED